VGRRRLPALLLPLALAFPLVGLARSQTGDPSRGASVWVSARCGSCHTFPAAGSTGTAGPRIDRWLAADAARAKLPVDQFALSRVQWGGRGMPPFGTELTPQQVEDVASFVVGAAVTAPGGGIPTAPSFDPKPQPVRVGTAVVARWRLRGVAAVGASVVAREGCLSCHTYRGSGTRLLGAPDLSRAGTRTTAGLVAYLRAPYRLGNVLMPSYVDLSAKELAAVAAFLRAVRK
jgi:mono/diheme cytochrome c family protein